MKLRTQRAMGTRIFTLILILGCGRPSDVVDGRLREVDLKLAALDDTLTKSARRLSVAADNPAPLRTVLRGCSTAAIRAVAKVDKSCLKRAFSPMIGANSSTRGFDGSFRQYIESGAGVPYFGSEEIEAGVLDFYYAGYRRVHDCLLRQIEEVEKQPDRRCQAALKSAVRRRSDYDDIFARLESAQEGRVAGSDAQRLADFRRERERRRQPWWEDESEVQTPSTPMADWTGVWLDGGTGPGRSGRGGIPLPGTILPGRDYVLVFKPSQAHAFGIVGTTAYLSGAGKSVPLGPVYVMGSPSGYSDSPTRVEISAGQLAYLTAQGSVSGLRLEFEGTGFYGGTGASYFVCAAFCAYLHEKGASVPAHACTFTRCRTGCQSTDNCTM